MWLHKPPQHGDWHGWRTTDIYDLRTGWERGEKGDVREECGERGAVREECGERREKRGERRAASI